MKLIPLNELQKAKIRLAYFAWKDMNQLNKKPYSSLLKFVWDSTQDKMTDFFSQIGESFQEIKQAFRTCELTLYPKISIGFEAHRKILIINLWSWMFCSLSTQSADVGFAPSFFKAAELFHEFQHYEYLKDNKMLGVAETELDPLREQHGSEMEELAFRRQIEILGRYKEVAPSEILIITFKVFDWKNSGNCTIKPKEYRLRTKGVIDGFIQQYKTAIDLVKKDASGSKYTEESDKNDVQTNQEISRALKLPMDVNQDESYYNKIEVRFQ